MNDKNVTYFLETVKKGSLTKAARSLSISQPALSMGLNTLENRLGFRLLDRKSYPVKLTKEGEIYLEYISSLEVLENNFSKQIRNCIEKSSRKVIIGAPLIYAETLLADFIGSGRVKADYAVKVGSQSELEELLENAEVDCYISTSNDIDGSAKKRVISTEEIMLCIPSSLDAEISDYSQLNGLKFVLLEEEQPLQKRINRFFDRFGIIPSEKVICNQVSACVSLARKSNAICFASREAIRSKNVSEYFQILELPDDLFKRDIYIVYDEDNFISETCKKVIEII